MMTLTPTEIAQMNVDEHEERVTNGWRYALDAILRRRTGAHVRSAMEAAKEKK